MKFFRKIFIILLVFCSSCSLFNFKKDDIVFNIDKPFSILEEGEYINFTLSSELEINKLKSIISLEQLNRKIDFEIEKEDLKYFIVPENEFIEGILVTLKIDGYLPDKNNKIVNLKKSINFYYKSSDFIGIEVEEFNPSSDEILNSNEIIITFSKNIDKDEIIKRIKVEPAINFKIETQENIAKIIFFENSLTNRDFINVKINSGKIGKNGEYFISDLSKKFYYCTDNSAPEITRIINGKIDNNNNLILTSSSIKHIQKEEVIVIESSEQLDFKSLKNSFSITPGITGFLDIYSENIYIFKPFKYPIPQGSYKIFISEKLKDKNGVNVFSKLEYNFIQNKTIPRLNSLSISNPETSTQLDVDIANIKNNSIFNIPFKYNDLNKNKILITLKFDREIDLNSFNNAYTYFRVIPFLPRKNLFSPDLINLNYSSTLNEMILEYEFTKPNINKFFYKVSIEKNSYFFVDRNIIFLLEGEND